MLLVAGYRDEKIYARKTILNLDWVFLVVALVALVIVAVDFVIHVDIRTL